MKDDITNKMLLEHMQGMKYELQQQIKDVSHELRQDMKSTKQELRQDMKDVQRYLEQKMDNGFEEAKEHRQALQEDLEATMRIQSRHTKKLATLSR